jgi:DNA-3-methyladenine glycosylase
VTTGGDPGELEDLLRRPAPEVAPLLLGAVVRRRTGEGVVAVRLTEVEAYDGENDPASHGFRGLTGRTRVMFGSPGHLYVYLSYGMHWCANVVTGVPGTASAVLLRAGEVVEGRDLARRRRGPHVRERALARGPGCLGQALGLSREQDGAFLLGDGPLTLSTGERRVGVSSGPRVGISVASDVPWRFWLEGEPSVSAYKRSPRAP